jgi:hypothetical protein
VPAIAAIEKTFALDRRRTALELARTLDPRLDAHLASTRAGAGDIDARIASMPTRLDSIRFAERRSSGTRVSF